MWGRGLKFLQLLNCLFFERVAPHVGAWIEIRTHKTESEGTNVAPHVGAWIEILESVTLEYTRCRRSPCGGVD